MVVRKRRVTVEDGWDFPADLREFDPDRHESALVWLAARRAVIPRPLTGEISARRWLEVIQEHYRFDREIRRDLNNT
jgi:hypothetical protein